jgi:hypothetical protein
MEHILDFQGMYFSIFLLLFTRNSHFPLLFMALIFWDEDPRLDLDHGWNDTRMYFQGKEMRNGPGELGTSWKGRRAVAARNRNEKSKSKSDLSSFSCAMAPPSSFVTGENITSRSL